MKDVIILQDQNNTLGCILCDALFKEDASMASCVVLHPQDNFLCVSVTAESPKQCVLRAVNRCIDEIDQIMQCVLAYDVDMDTDT